MANIGRDTFLARKLLTGLLAAAGSGVAIYFGYKKWISQSKGSHNLTDASSIEETSAEVKKPEEPKAEEDSDDAVKSDPTPVLQPEAISSTNSSPLHDPESLSVSGTFEKVSLSAFQERAHESEDSAIHSPSESFEKVSLPPSNNEAVDLHTSVPSATGHVTTSSLPSDTTVRSPRTTLSSSADVKREPPKMTSSSLDKVKKETAKMTSSSSDDIKKEPVKTISSSSGDVKREPLKPEAKTEVKSSAGVQLSKPHGSASGTKVSPSSDPEPTSKDQQKPVSDRDESTHGATEHQDDSDKKGDEKDDPEDEEDADEEEDEDEEGSSSDASADSQVKDD